MLVAIGLFLLIGGFLIAVHELGHFLFAKAFGVKVHEFMIGFGPALLRFNCGDTVYSLRLVPLGGAVRMKGYGETDETNKHGESKRKEFGEKESIVHTKDSFYAKPYWQRILIVAGGPLFNFVLGAIIFFVTLTFVNSPLTVVEVLADSPASISGLMPGDQIVAVDGQRTRGANDLVRAIQASASEDVVLSVKRGTEVLEIRAKPDDSRKLGITIQGQETVEPSVALSTSVGNAVSVMGEIGTSLWSGIKGNDDVELTGPIGIAGALKDAAMSGPEYLLTLIAVISLNLAFFNLLPIPLLDGGQILLLLVEAFGRKKLSRQTVAIMQTIGVTFMLLLVVFVTFNDIVRLLTTQ